MVENSIGAIQTLLSYKIIVILLSFLSFHFTNFVTGHARLSKEFKAVQRQFYDPCIISNINFLILTHIVTYAC